MAADIFELVNQLSVLLAARRPQWVEQVIPTTAPALVPGIPDGGTNGAPASVGAGADLEDSPRSTVVIDLRRDAAFRTARITIRVLDLTSIYRVRVDGTAVDFDAGFAGATSAADVLNGWRDAILGAGPPVDTIVTARTEDSTGLGGDVDTLIVEGIGVDDYGFKCGATTGTAEMDISIDASSANAHIWFSAKEPNAPTAEWRQANGALYPVARRGFVERFDTGGLARGYVELANVDGDADDEGLNNSELRYYAEITHGPAVLEVT
jgi:hypothetical protein